MKNRLFLLALAASIAVFMTGCGQSQAGIQAPADNASHSSSAGSSESSSQNSTQLPEVSPDTSTEPSEPDQSAGEVDSIGSSSEEAEQSGDAPDSGADSSETKPDASETESPESSTAPAAGQTPPSVSVPEQEAVTESEPETEPADTPTSSTSLSGTNLTLQFGGGESFTIHMYDNPTSNKIAEYVGTAAWQLPIYHFDDYDGWENFQYYDIPRRYDIPDGSQAVTSAKAGAVYYSHPNRIILFYQDATVSTEYTPVGYIDFSQDLVDAVGNNPVVEGWGNKLVFIQP